MRILLILIIGFIFITPPLLAEPFTVNGIGAHMDDRAIKLEVSMQGGICDNDSSIQKLGRICYSSLSGDGDDVIFYYSMAEKYMVFDCAYANSCDMTIEDMRTALEERGDVLAVDISQAKDAQNTEIMVAMLQDGTGITFPAHGDYIMLLWGNSIYNKPNF